MGHRLSAVLELMVEDKFLASRAKRKAAHHGCRFRLVLRALICKPSLWVDMGSALNTCHSCINDTKGY